MRTRINNYKVLGSRTIEVDAALKVEDIRLIINETKKIVICSSMQKDNITLEDGIINYADTLPESETTDVFTIEVDRGAVDSTTYMPCDRTEIDNYWNNQPTKEE